MLYRINLRGIIVKKIIIVNNLLGYYGAENVLINLLKGLDKTKFEITLLTLNESDISCIKNFNIKYKFIFSKKSNILSRLTNKIKLVLGYDFLSKVYCRNFDVGISFKMGECAKLVGKSNSKEKYCWIHSNVSEIDEEYSYGFKNKEEEINLLKNFDSLIAVSESCKNSFVKKYGELFNVRVIYNPVNIDVIQSKAKEQLSKSEEDLFSQNFIIGTVARLDEKQKRISWLIKLSNYLDKAGINHKMVIIGGGNDESEYRSMIEKLKANNVILLGFKDNPYKYLKQFDLFICSSFWESYSIVVNEAISLGVPTISTKCGGPEEVLEHGKYGVLCDNNFEELKETVVKYLTKTSNFKLNKYDASKSITDFINNVENMITEK